MLPGPRTNLLILPFFAVILLACASAEARERNVEDWVGNELAGYVAKQLRDLPRFRDSTMRFVVFESGRPVAETNQLALRLRDRLQRRVLESEGIRIGWQPDPATSGLALPASANNCEADDVDLLVGLEVRELNLGELEFSVRALDVVERSWIAGFSKAWRGSLSREQRNAYRASATDRVFLGERGVPYRHTETDLMARHLAHDLACQLMRQLSGDYRIARLGPAGTDENVDRVLTLVRHEVAGVNSLQLVGNEAGTNATLEGKVHPIDRSLHQFWVTLSPDAGDEALAPLSASVYVRLPDYPIQDPIVFGKPSLAAASPGIRLQAPANGILKGVRFVRVTSPAVCGNRGARVTGSYSGRRDNCAALRVNTRPDAVVFVLNHQLNRGLVRLGDERCLSRPAARISTSGSGVLVVLPGSDAGGDWSVASDWDTTPAGETYYAIAVKDSKTARSISDLIARLPQRCSDSVRPGLKGSELERWLTDLDRELVRSDRATDWRAVRVRQVY